MSVDPLADKYPGINPYAYTLNNPVRLVDPTGMGAEWYPEYDNEKRTINLVAEEGDNKQSLKEWSNGLFSDKQIDQLYSQKEDGKIDLGETEVGRFIEGFIEDEIGDCKFNCFASPQSGKQDFTSKVDEDDFRDYISSNDMKEYSLSSETLKDAKPFKSFFGYSLLGSGGTELDHVSINTGKDRSGATWSLHKNGFDGKFYFQKGTKYNNGKYKAFPDKIFK